MNEMNELMKNQIIGELECDICKNDKYLYNDKFFICSCKKYICPLCAKSHEKTHKMIEYKNRFYKCIKHNYNFISYCNTCNMNLCDKCEDNHNSKHKRILYKEKKQSEKKIDEMSKEIKEIERKIKRCKMEIKKLNNLYMINMNNFINDLDNYILLYEKINISDNLKNYEFIQNINNFKNKKLIKNIDEFLNENLKNKFKKLIDIIYNAKYEMSITYKNDEKINLFGEVFIKNNKDNCFLLYNDKIIELCEVYNFNKKEKSITVKLVEEKEIENMSYMFFNCLSLLSVDMTKWNLDKVLNVNYMFLGCSSLYNLCGISKWDTTKVNSMDYMFLGCQKLKPFPNISKNNVKNEQKKNEMLIRFNNKKNAKIIRIFGEEFVRNNKDNCN